MKRRKEADGRWILALSRGQSVREQVERLAHDEGIAGAEVRAVGALEDPEVAWYDLDARTYRTQVLDGRWELVSLMGNISLKDGEPFLHAHVALSGPDMEVRGGHLVDARIAVVGEVIVDPWERALHRTPNDAVGLPVWDVSK